jgi:glycosyltransferase involved in cell wall biosynthesis
MKSCLLIPIYNHGETIAEVVGSLESLGLPCFVIDDGSDATTRQELDRVEEKFPWVEVKHLAENGGRGVALRAGYRLAAQRGMSHAIQLDADGQHAADDVPRFLEAIESDPEALILGTPIFDDSAPAVRLHGRKLSQGLVWIETLSFAVRDPLCGFRAFPLEATLALLDRCETGDRMDFDPEIATRLVWEGLRVINIPSRVIYRKGGLSHFAMFRDNARLVSLHARLLLGGLLRTRALLGRRLQETS